MSPRHAVSPRHAARPSLAVIYRHAVSPRHAARTGLVAIPSHAVSPVPDKRSRIPEVIVGRHIFNLGTGNFEWGGGGKG